MASSVQKSLAHTIKDDLAPRFLTFQMLQATRTNEVSTRHNMNYGQVLELVSKELNHLAAILHVYAGGLNFMK